MHYGPRRSCMTGLPRSAVFPFDMSLEKYTEIFYICMKKKHSGLQRILHFGSQTGQNWLKERLYE